MPDNITTFAENMPLVIQLIEVAVLVVLAYLLWKRGAPEQADARGAEAVDRLQNTRPVMTRLETLHDTDTRFERAMMTVDQAMDYIARSHPSSALVAQLGDLVDDIQEPGPQNRIPAGDVRPEPYIERNPVSLDNPPVTLKPEVLHAEPRDSQGIGTGDPVG